MTSPGDDVGFMPTPRTTVSIWLSADHYSSLVLRCRVPARTVVGLALLGWLATACGGSTGGNLFSGPQGGASNDGSGASGGQLGAATGGTDTGTGGVVSVTAARSLGAARSVVFPSLPTGGAGNAPEAMRALVASSASEVSRMRAATQAAALLARPAVARRRSCRRRRSRERPWIATARSARRIKAACVASTSPSGSFEWEDRLRRRVLPLPVLLAHSR